MRILVTTSFSSIGGLATDTHGNLFFSDSGDFNVRAVTGIAAILLTPQTITFNQSLPEVAYGVAPITLTAISSSGLPISYSVTGPATVSGSTLTITGAGAVTVTASQAGNSTFAAAASVMQTFTVDKGTITVTAASFSLSFDATPPTLTYTVMGLAPGTASPELPA